ncbi:transmembrane domain-containing protein TMIGD3-like isoform X4 [Platichthys flesus]|uniref:transmembrane domain-containing protein TMIGD3-like isoform X4 n=1 Tax=Platichthys flesus TaxID=8260 RepID=UPI002DBCCEB7|nr:transmembrane domain-containing protein TMIGD3-like isoform X4 [Platichthys flesus]
MSSMEQVFLILILAGGFWKTEAITVKGELGRNVTITCSHSNAYKNVKYFCKAPCRNKDVLIKSSESSKGRYSIKDEGNTFKVTISRLTEGDAGTYQCLVERVGLDTFQEVVLTVVKGKTKEPDDDFSQSTRGKLVYIGGGLGGAVLALAVVLLIFYKHQKKEISTTSGMQDNTYYASPSSLSGNGHNSRDQSDELFYSTVNSNTPADCRGVPCRPAEVTYSTIRHIPMEESDLYCNL